MVSNSTFFVLYWGTRIDTFGFLLIKSDMFLTIPFALLKVQTSYEKSCAIPLFESEQLFLNQ